MKRIIPKISLWYIFLSFFLLICFSAAFLLGLLFGICLFSNTLFPLLLSSSFPYSDFSYSDISLNSGSVYLIKAKNWPTSNIDYSNFTKKREKPDFDIESFLEYLCRLILKLTSFPKTKWREFLEKNFVRRITMSLMPQIY